MYNNTPVIKTHFGLWGECISLNALKRVEEETIDLIYREHVTNYIYTHPSSFDIKLIDVPEIVRKNKGIRLTVDTIDDFRIAQKLYTSTRNNQSIEYLINEIVNDNYLLETMRVQIKANTK
jgi:spore coat polysaccharide biosynthesis protein SpsF